jgi:8-oxo-dGTP pyrophosphatase MutT (NUDIX family)
MPHEISSGAIVYYKENHKIQYLILHYEEGHWDFPKGHAKGNEKLEETAIRETKEETNIDVKLNPEFKESISYFYRNKEGVLMKKSVYFFLGKSDTKKVKLSFEHIGFAWLSYEKALEKLTYDNAKEILKKANQFLTQKTLEDF